MIIVNGIKYSGTKDLLGRRFGILTVVDFSHIDKNRQSCWKVRCDCGNEKIINSNRLLRLGAKSCGCSRRGLKGERGFNNLYAKYRCRAKYIKVQFTLTKEEFRDLVVAPCYYCGILPEQKVYDDSNKQLTEYINHCQFIYNGIDRKDCNAGYVLENCVTCCKVCNFAKNTKTKDEFITWINQIYKNLETKGKIYE
jgi:hypothetical protein